RCAASPRRLGGGAGAKQARLARPSHLLHHRGRHLGGARGRGPGANERPSMPRVLVVDDQKTIVETCRLYLEAAGFDVVVGYNGEQALAEAREAKPDLIVLDL